MSEYSSYLDSASAPAWRDLEPNDRLIGIVTDLDTFDSDYGDPAPVITVQVSDPSSSEGGELIAVGEERRLFGYGTVLRREIAKLEPQIGDTIGCKFLGVAEKAKPGQHPARLWKLRVFERGTYGQALEQGRAAALATPTSSDLSAVEAARVAAAAAELEAKAAAEKVAAAQAKTVPDTARNRALAEGAGVEPNFSAPPTLPATQAAPVEPVTLEEVAAIREARAAAEAAGTTVPVGEEAF